jgi:mono/diheme cytochrome c family protein
MRVANAAKTTLIAFGCVLLGYPVLAQSPVPLDGPSVYRAYCAACHGADGKGHGPAAEALKRKPTDLTTIAKNNAGMFPRTTLQDVLTNGGKWKAHGSKEMPTWGPIFMVVDKDEKIAYAHIYNLLTYLESIQVK